MEFFFLLQYGKQESEAEVRGGIFILHQWLNNLPPIGLQSLTFSTLSCLSRDPVWQAPFLWTRRFEKNMKRQI